MGGGSYDRDVYTTHSFKSNSGHNPYATYTPKAAKDLSRTSAQADLLPSSRKADLISTAENPIVIALDGTGSMGDWARIIYDKLPLFWHELVKKEYLKDPEISFAVVGDANCDNTPIQICNFAKSSELDTWLKKIYLEGGGGGQYHESYELTAWYYANKMQITARPEDAFFFFIGDEGFYPDIEASFIRDLCDKNYKGGDVDAKDAFAALQRKMNVFLVHKKYDICGGSEIDKKIVKEWEPILGVQNILPLDQAKAVIDVMLGAISIVAKTRTLDDYVVDMKDRGQSNARLQLVQKTLKELSDSTALVKVEKNLPTVGIKRRGISRRI